MSRLSRAVWLLIFAVVTAFVSSSSASPAFFHGPLSAIAPSVDSPFPPAGFQEEIVWTAVPGPGKKCPINDDYYFKYEFSEKPKMGLVILKIQVFDKKKNQVVPFKIVGRSDMPSMRGAHDSGEIEFKINKVGNYLLPVNIAMPGEWEIQVVFGLNDKPVFHGSIRFDV